MKICKLCPSATLVGTPSCCRSCDQQRCRNATVCEGKDDCLAWRGWRTCLEKEFARQMLTHVDFSSTRIWIKIITSIITAKVMFSVVYVSVCIDYEVPMHLGVSLRIPSNMEEALPPIPLKDQPEPGRKATLLGSLPIPPKFKLFNCFTKKTKRNEEAIPPE